MPGHDEHDLERRLREERPEARDEFVQSLVAEVRGRRSHPSARPRLTLAFALSLALLVSMVAFGGVGAAKDAVSSSTQTVRHAIGDGGGKDGRKHHDDGEDPAHHQYHPKVDICVARVHYVYTYKWVWKQDDERQSPEVRKHRKHHGHLVRVRVRIRVIVYETERVPQTRVPELVSHGAVYPVPAGGCETLNPKPTND